MFLLPAKLRATCLHSVHTLTGVQTSLTNIIVGTFCPEAKWWSKLKVLVNFTLEQGKKDQKHSSTLSLTLALDGVGGQRHAQTALPPDKTRYTMYRRLGGPQDYSGRIRKISPPPGFDPRTVKPVPSLCTE